jgi:hypothetical protein
MLATARPLFIKNVGAEEIDDRELRGGVANELGWYEKSVTAPTCLSQEGRVLEGDNEGGVETSTRVLVGDRTHM